MHQQQRNDQVGDVTSGSRHHDVPNTDHDRVARVDGQIRQVVVGDEVKDSMDFSQVRMLRQIEISC